MRIAPTFKHFYSGHRVIFLVILCLFGLSAVFSQRKQGKKRQQPQTEDNRVYLVHADRLHYDQYVNPEAQILNGSVAFRHQGATLYCDSAHFYEMSNSFEAFGNVKMYQGDTLSLFSEYAYYDGNDQMAMARRKVVLKHRQTTLYTDSLNYDRMYGVGYFFEHGKMVDKTSVLISDWGEYNTGHRQAVFYYNVDLKDKKFHLTSDTLYYNTALSMAHAVGPSDVYSGSSHIYTEDGWYDTKQEQSWLLGRSIIRDSGRFMTGDSVYHDSKNGTSEAFRHIIYIDSVNRNKLTGNYCFYNENTGYAMATDSAVCIDYSQKDSLYMHADTFKLFT